MTRLEQARAIFENAAQSETHCPFMNAMTAETRAELNQEFPNPHALSQSQLLEIAAQHGFSTASSNQTPVGANLVFALPHNNLEIPNSENVFFSTLAKQKLPSQIPFLEDSR